MGVITEPSRFGSTADPRRIIAAPGVPGHLAPGAAPVTLPQELIFSWARSATVAVAAVTSQRVPGRFGERFQLSMSFPAGTLDMSAPALAITLDPGDSSSGVFHISNFANVVQLWDTVDASRSWVSGSTGVISRTAEGALLVQGITLRDSAGGGPQVNRIRLDGTLRFAG